jgi:hypothetical protein
MISIGYHPSGRLSESIVYALFFTFGQLHLNADQK